MRKPIYAAGGSELVRLKPGLFSYRSLQEVNTDINSSDGFEKHYLSRAMRKHVFMFPTRS